jgi:hypothetical protein
MKRERQMIKGATSKRFNYFLSSFFRMVSFIGLLIAYIVVKIVVRPQIGWLNILLLMLSITSLVTSIFNLILCGFSATAYRNKKFIQIICFVVTLVSGGMASSALTGVAVFTPVLDDEVENEGIVHIKKQKRVKK